MNFDKAKILKIIILPSRLRFFRCHILKAFPIPIMVFFRFCSSSIFSIFLFSLKYSQYFNASLVKSVHLIPQTATFTPCSSSTPAASHFEKFDFKPQNDENKEIVFSNSYIKPNFLRKKSSYLHQMYIGRYFQEFVEF